MAAWTSRTIRLDNGYVVELMPAAQLVDRRGAPIVARNLIAQTLDEVEEHVRNFAEEVESARPAPMPQVPQPGATVQ
jgi:hypothetical protein